MAAITVCAQSPDDWKWQAYDSGRFSSASASALLRSASLPPMDDNWIKLWRFQGPTRPSLHLWMLKQGRLPTAEYLWRRHVLPCPTCPICSAACEDILHAVRDCPRARASWESLLSGSGTQPFWQVTNVEDWINLNLSAPMERLTNQLHWRYIFKQCLLDLWIARNDELHRNRNWPGVPFFVKTTLSRVLATLVVGSFRS